MWEIWVWPLGMATHSSILAWRILWIEEPARLQSMWSQSRTWLSDWHFHFLSAFFVVQVSHPYMTTGKTIALTRWTFVGKEISLLFHMLSRFVTAFLPRNKRLLISWLQSPSAVILEPKKIKTVRLFQTRSPSLTEKLGVLLGQVVPFTSADQETLDCWFIILSVVRYLSWWA